MTLRYLLVDDDAGAESPAEVYVREILRVAEDTLTVQAIAPASLEGILDLIRQERPDGLFLDIALSNTLGADRKPLPFDGITLAQQIRTLQTRARTSEAGLPEMPLIRLSKRNIVDEYVSGDTTSDDLFDARIDKSEINDAPEGVVRRAVSLAADYPQLIFFADGEPTSARVATLLGCSPDFLDRLDDRVLVGARRPGAPAHIIARFLTGALLAAAGPLIDERLLAIRLGIDPDLAKSGSWAELRKRLDPARYLGAFGEGYPRWWMPLLLDWWAASIDEAKPPFRLSATARVEALRAATGLAALEPIASDPDSPGERPWHQCVRSGRPVDPATGFALIPAWPHESWHDAEYLCLEEARRASRDPRLGPIERSRLAEIARQA